MGQHDFKIQVVSLAHQHDRRAKMTQLLAGVDREWSFLDAISGKDIAPYAHLYDQEKRRKVLGYDMKPNEIACVLSHREIWKHCVRDNVPYLILEDDVKVAADLPDFNAVIPLAQSLCARMGDQLFVRLGNSRARGEKVPVCHLPDSRELVRYLEDPLSSFAYMVSPQVAARLIEGSEHFFMPVDNFMWRGWEHGCVMHEVFPQAIITSEEDNPSSIGDRSKPKIGLWQKVRREYYRFFDNKDKVLFERSVINQIKNKNGGSEDKHG